LHEHYSKELFGVAKVRVKVGFYCVLKKIVKKYLQKLSVKKE
jgi:hypothetical protein